MTNPNFKLFLELKKSVAVLLNIPNGANAAKIAGMAQKEIKEANPDLDMLKICQQSFQLIKNNPSKYLQNNGHEVETKESLIIKKEKILSELEIINEKLEALGHKNEININQLEAENQALKNLVKIMTTEVNNLLTKTDPIFLKYEGIIKNID